MRNKGAFEMIRICPERDAACPAGMSCPYAKDRYACVPGWEGLDKSHNPEGFTPALEVACRLFRCGARDHGMGDLRDLSVLFLGQTDD